MLFTDLLESLAVCGFSGSQLQLSSRRSMDGASSRINNTYDPNHETVQHLSIRLPRQQHVETSESAKEQIKTCRILYWAGCCHHKEESSSIQSSRGTQNHYDEAIRFRAIVFALVTSLAAVVLFIVSSFRCDTFQFQESIQFGLWYIRGRGENNSCTYWDTDDVWVRRGRIASILGIVLGGVIVIYLTILLCGHFLEGSCWRIPSSLAIFRVFGGSIAIGMVGTVSLASTIVRSDLCNDQCIVTFSGLYCAAILWVATGCSLLLVPLCTTERSSTEIDPWKNHSNPTNSATSNEDHGEEDADAGEGGFAIVKTFNNGETHITETVNEKDGTIRRTHIVKKVDGTERIFAKTYDDETPYSPDEDDDEESTEETSIVDQEHVVNILLSDSPEDARPISTTIHWGSLATSGTKPVTYFQEPLVEAEPPEPFAVFSLSHSTATTNLSFTCPVPDILRDDDDDNHGAEDESSCALSIPSTISFNRPPEDDNTESTPYGPHLPSSSANRQDVV